MTSRVQLALVLLANLVGCGSTEPVQVQDVRLPSAATSAPPVAATSAGLPLRGPCVPIPELSFRVDRVHTQSSPPDPSQPFQTNNTVSVATDRSLDIDGDGARDALVPEPAEGDCNFDLHRAVYVARGDCGHKVGVVAGSVEPKTGPISSGLPELTTVVEVGAQPDPLQPARRRTIKRTYRFDGATYRKVHEQSEDVVCHHCSTVRCTISTLAPDDQRPMP
ncbi:MAG: hypothetical protein JNL21_14900 [Myxococcales bacterium]|nr:hypothetical protein [Myxococcales bacterium]